MVIAPVLSNDKVLSRGAINPSLKSLAVARLPRVQVSEERGRSDVIDRKKMQRYVPLSQQGKSRELFYDLILW